MAKKRTRIDSERRSTPTPYPDTPVFSLDDFKDYVAFHRKCDIIEHGSTELDEKMSQKKCRFCD